MEDTGSPWDAVILGGGMGGLSAAVRLRQLAPTARRILVVEAAAWHTLRPKLPEAVGGYCRCNVRLPLADLLAARHVSFLQADVRAIDPASHRVSVQTDGDHVWTLDYGTLVVALGSVPAVPVGPGEAGRLLPLWSFDDACGLRRRLGLMASRAKRVADAGPLSIAIVGGGFIGAEVASAVAGLSRALVAGTSLQPQITLLEREARILPNQAPAFSRMVTSALAARGVCVRAGRRVTEIGHDTLTLDDGTAVPAATAVWTGGVRPHPVVAGLAGTEHGGRIPVSDLLEARGLPDVFVAGDDACPPGPEAVAPFNRSASYAAAAGHLVAENVAARWRGRPGRRFRPHVAPLLIELDPRHVLGLTAGGRLLVGAAPLLKQAAMARHIWRVGGWRTLRAMFRRTFWEPWSRRAPEVQCPSPDVQEAVPVLFARLHPRT